MAEDRLVPDEMIKDEDRLVPDNMIRPEDAVAPAGSEPESIYKDGTPWYKELAFNLALAGSNASPTRFATTPLGQQLGSGIVSGATAGNVDGGAPAPATALEKGVSALGHGAGMAAPFVAAAPVMAPLGLAGAPVGFAAYEAARPADSLGERAKNAGHGALMGAAFTGLGAVGGAVARKMPGLLKPVTRPAIDTAALTGLNVAQGMEPDDALLNAAPFVMGGSIAHAATGAPKRTGDQKLSKTPAELEAPKFRETEARQKRLTADQAKEAALAPVEGEPLTVPLSRYAKGETSPVEFVKELRESRAMEGASEALKANVAEGNVRDVGFSQTMGRHRQIQGMSGGTHNNQIQRATLRTWELLDRVKAKLDTDLRSDWVDRLNSIGIKQKSKDWDAFADFMRLYRTGEDPAAVAKTPEGREILARAENPKAIIEAAPVMREGFDMHWEIRDHLMKAAGEKEGMPYREKYYPDMEKIYGWRNPIKMAEQRTRPVKEGRAEARANPRVFSGRELAQTGSTANREKNPYGFLDRFSHDTANKVGNTVALSAGENVVAELNSAGYKEAARGLRAVTQMVYGGIDPSIAGREISAMRSNRIGSATLASELWLKQRFNEAKYTVALPFVGLRQYTSLGLLAAHGNIPVTKWAEILYNAAKPSAGEKYRQTYTGYTKTSDTGRIGQEGALYDLSPRQTVKPQNRIAQGLRTASEKPVNWMENITGRIAVETAEVLSRKANMSAQDRLHYLSDVVAKTQSMYDRPNRAPISNSPTLNLFFPAQSFPLEGANTFREIFTKDAGLNTYTTASEKTAAAVRTAAAMFVLNGIYTAVTSHEDDPIEMLAENLENTAGGFVPYVPSVMGSVKLNLIGAMKGEELEYDEYGGGVRDGKVYPAKLAEDTQKALVHFYNGDVEKGFSEMAKNLVRGGAQYDRASDTNMMIKRGVLSEEERLQGSMFGWWTTESGKQYLREMGGDKDEAPSTLSRTPAQRPRPRVVRPRPPARQPARRP